MSKIRHLFETSNKGTSNIEEIRKPIKDSNFEGDILPVKYYNELEKMIGQVDKIIKDKTKKINIVRSGGVINCFEIEIPPGA